jgi:hypothetical protein
VLVDSTRATKEVTSLNVVVKNEELALQANNHCHEIYQKVAQAINDNKGWNLLRSAESNIAG